MLGSDSSLASESAPIDPFAQVAVIEISLIKNLKLTKHDIDRMSARDVIRYFIVLDEIARLEEKERKRREQEMRMRTRSVRRPPRRR